MRHIDEIIVHCTATPAGRHHTVADIDLWHRRRGFTMIGYHYLVLLDGTIQEGRPVTKPGAHCTGHNAHSIGVCYVGGLDSQMRPADTRTPAQREALIRLIRQLLDMFPKARVLGHCNLAAKACPCFDARAEYSHLNVGNGPAS